MIPRTPVIFCVILIAGGAVALPTCAEAQISEMLSPEQSEDRVVTVVQGKSSVLTLAEPMVFLDIVSGLPATKGVRFPSGEYDLEAEDADYLYYRAPDRIEYRVFQSGQVKAQRFMPGGIYFSKALITLVPAGAYLSSDGTNKTLLWKLGAEFTHLEGTKWTRTKVTGEADK